MKYLLPLLLVLGCRKVEGTGREGESLRVKLWSLQDRMDVLERRWSEFDRCITAKVPETENEFQLRMAILTCVAVARLP